MVSVRIYIEGGGDSAAQKAEFRQGFSAFWEKAGLKGKKPKTVVCGSRNSAFQDFCSALKSHPDEMILLLIDSEDPVPPNTPKWDFLKKRDGWDRPLQVGEEHVYLMIQTMEAWLLADRMALKNYYGNNFNSSALPVIQNPIESLGKNVMYESLRRATENTTKKSYSKGGHSFQLIGLIDPQKVKASCPAAQQLIDHLIDIS